MINMDLDRLSLEQLHDLKRRVGGVALRCVEGEIRIRTSSVPQADGASIDLTLEKDVEQAVIREMQRFGWDVVKLSQPQRVMATAGTPDLYARHLARRLRLWIECKVPSGRVSAEQKRWHSAEREAGGQVIVVWSVRDLHDELRARGFEV